MSLIGMWRSIKLPECVPLAANWECLYEREK